MRWRGAASILLLLLTWAALDDITTDNATTFVPEYTMLIGSGVWFAALGVWLLIRRRATLGLASLVALATGVVACWSLPHHYAPVSRVNLLGYVPLVWFLGLAVWLLASRRAGGARGTAAPGAAPGRTA